MSNRTSEANKAIAAAWASERQLVLNGKGTRNWTPEQQKDILTKGKAYGEDGKAFEGHHMKSAEAYPEFQGECCNIEFLSRTEHLLAHNGDFRNPTNGYFNPQTGETKEFGDDLYEPCKVQKLSNPINTQQITEVKSKQTVQSMEEKIVDRDSAEYQQNVVSKLNSMEHKHTDAEAKINSDPQSTREALNNTQINTNAEGNS